MILDQSYSESLELLKLGEPCYVLRAEWGDVYHEAMSAAGYRALYHNGADVSFREQIGDAWKGRGFACLLYPCAQWESVVHELAHHLEYLPAFSTGFKLFGQLVRPEVYFDAVRIVDSGAAEDDKPKWHLHGLTFIRACLHLTHRLAKTDAPVSLEDTGAGHPYYGLSGSAAYAQAFGDEPTKHEQLPLREVMDLPMPQAALDLWTRDTASK